MHSYSRKNWLSIFWVNCLKVAFQKMSTSRQGKNHAGTTRYKWWFGVINSSIACCNHNILCVSLVSRGVHVRDMTVYHQKRLWISDSTGAGIDRTLPLSTVIHKVFMIRVFVYRFPRSRRKSQRFIGWFFQYLKFTTRVAILRIRPKNIGRNDLHHVSGESI